jgi:hypothetical protein
MVGVTETESPWRPGDTAPKTGEDFIGYDDNIEHTEVMRWDKDRNEFENANHDDANFTRWMVKPPKIEERRGRAASQSLQ